MLRTAMRFLLNSSSMEEWVASVKRVTLQPKNGLITLSSSRPSEYHMRINEEARRLRTGSVSCRCYGVNRRDHIGDFGERPRTRIIRHGARRRRFAVGEQASIARVSAVC